MSMSLVEDMLKSALSEKELKDNLTNGAVVKRNTKDI